MEKKEIEFDQSTKENEIVIQNPDGTTISYDSEARKGRYKKKKSISDIFTILCCGVALASDGYQNNLMTMINLIFTKLYPKVYTSQVKTNVSNALTVGEILGQISIGLTCDYMGRKWAIVATTVLIVVGSILACAAHGSTTLGMIWMFLVMRGAIGVGVGGEYSACSSASSESANEASKNRGKVFVLVTNLPLSLGGPIAISVFLIVYSAAGSDHLNTVWRVCTALGAVWPLVIFWFRFKMNASVLFEKSQIKSNVPYWLVFKYYWIRLIGTCGCWFIYDFVTFPNGIFSSTIIAGVLGDQSSDIKKVAEWTLLLGWLSIPGVLIGAFTVDKLGRKWSLIIGFSGYLVIGLVIGCAFDQVKGITALFIVLYGLFNSFGNFGPGNNMGLTSSECYATPVRGTLYGISAALGKTGAVVGTQAFTAIKTNLGQRWTFIISAILGSVGVVLAYFTIPHLKEDDLMMEDVRFEKYLRENGWEGRFGMYDSSSDEQSLDKISVDKLEFEISEKS
uniref:MFS transporter n=1 Tax=Cyberlindnera americana TaxID=36016 RepID=A0A5P8N8D3_9ASCO|nr:MFS transporter [Cyberlindnera americana]